MVCWYVDNDATSHVTTKQDLFINFRYFGSNHIVSTANGQSKQAIRKDNIDVKSVVNGRLEDIR